MKRSFERTISLLIVCVLVAGMLPSAAWAKESSDGNTVSDWFSHIVKFVKEAFDGDDSSNNSSSQETGTKLEFNSQLTEDSEKLQGTAVEGIFEYFDIDGGVRIVGYSGWLISDTMMVPHLLGGEKVLDIGTDAFQNLSYYSNVILLDGVSTISDNAFKNCYYLNITVPESVNSISDSAFIDCPNLTIYGKKGSYAENYANSHEITFTENDISYENGFGYRIVDNEAWITGYTGAGGNLIIPKTLGGKTVTTIDKLAFSNCVALTSVVIPDSVLTIGNGAFSNCTRLASVTLPNNIKSIGEYAFISCVYLNNIFIPGSIAAIEGGTFGGCKSLSSITLCDGVASIGWGAFAGCDNLKTVSLPNSVTAIGGGAFSSCYSLTSIKLPDNITSLEGTFSGCSSLSSIDLPDNLEILGEKTFENCFSLEDISISEGLTTIGAGAFYQCSILKSIELPNTVTTIGHNAFCDCRNLINIKLSVQLEEIQPWTFTRCKALKNIVIPGSVTSIGEYAFWQCNSLTCVNIPRNVKSIGTVAFADCEKLDAIYCYSPNMIFDFPFPEATCQSIPQTTTIIGYKNSTAEEYASSHSLNFVSFNIDDSNIDEKALFEKFPYKPNEFSQDLALRAAEFSMLAYDSYAYNVETNYGYRDTGISHVKPEFLIKKLNEQKFYNITTTKTYCDDDPNNVSFVIANKDVYYNDEPRVLTVVIIKGTDGVEWKGDMDVTGDSYDGSLKNHWSFDAAKDGVISELDQYLKDHHISNSLLLVTGHSRGAAVANLVANDLTNNDSTDGVGDVFAYTFATPNVTVNPDYSKTNIFNFCFMDDFVPQVPLEYWSYGKNGITYKAIAQDAHSENSNFKNESDLFARLSNINEKGASFNYNSTTRLIYYTYWKWSTVQSFYEKQSWPVKIGFPTKTLHNFFKNTIAQLAIDRSPQNLVNFWGDIEAYPDFLPISKFFINGNVVSQDVVNNHQMFNYYSALKNGVFNQTPGGGGSGTGWSIDVNKIETVNVTTMSTPTNCNGEEVQKIKDFANQDDNLAKLGWNLDDISTWSGVTWSDGTENRVVSLDLKFKELTGTLDLSGFTSLEAVDVSGNSLTSISFTGCNGLTRLNCAYNELTQLDLTNCPQIKTLNCNGNLLETLNIDGCVVMEELDCSYNQLSNLNLSTNTALTSLYCGNNNLIGLDLTANTLLMNFDCEGNYFDVHEGSAMYGRIQNILGMNNGWVSYEYQKIRENASFNSDDVAKLSDFASQGENLSKLQWDISAPSTWFGVEWVLVGNEYRVSRLNLNDLGLTGDLNATCLTNLTSLACNGNQLNAIDVSDCGQLTYLSCYNVGAKSLKLNNCPSLITLECQNNYLDISAGTELREKLDSTSQKDGAIVGYAVQKIDASLEDFNETERKALQAFGVAAGNQEYLNWNSDRPGDWVGITWEKIDGKYHVTGLSLSSLPVAGSLDLSEFSHLFKLDCAMSTITEVKLPENYTSIEKGAFYDCSALTGVVLPEGVTMIGDEAFYHCSALKTITIPAGVTSIGEGAFAGCTMLSTVEIPEKTESLGKYAFLDCTGLTEIQFVSKTTVLGDDFNTIPETAVIKGYDPSMAKDYAVKFGKYFETIKDDTIQLGDVDGSGSVTAYDALMALQIAAGKRQGSEAELKAADVDGTVGVGSYDALKILQYATGKITTF